MLEWIPPDTIVKEMKDLMAYGMNESANDRVYRVNDHIFMLQVGKWLLTYDIYDTSKVPKADIKATKVKKPVRKPPVKKKPEPNEETQEETDNFCFDLFGENLVPQEEEEEADFGFDLFGQSLAPQEEEEEEADFGIDLFS